MATPMVADCTVTTDGGQCCPMQWQLPWAQTWLAMPMRPNRWTEQTKWVGSDRGC